MIRSKLQTALKEAMKAREATRLATLRLVNAAIKDREIAARGEDEGVDIGDVEVVQILSKMVKQRQESAKAYEEGGRLELAEQEREEIKIIQEFLPKQLTETEMRDAVAAAVSETGAEGVRDMGRVMGVLKSRYAGRMDFGRAGAEVKAALG